MKPNSSKLIFAGLICGCLMVAGSLYLFFSLPTPQTAASAPIAGPNAESRVASATSSAPAGLAHTHTANPAEVQLRPANFPCDQATIDKALELKRAGWTYAMPQPRDARARWGNSDDRTTWWVGYWTNERNHTTSASQPQRNASNQWVGDGKGIRTWRRGGSPVAPTKIEWLCSTSGGITPQ